VVTPLALGRSQHPADLFQGIEPVEVERLLAAAGDTPPPDAYVSAFLVETGGRRVLIDTGLGQGLDEALRAAGVDPASVNAVAITHSHPDHVGGLLTADGAARFPNATLHLHAVEADFWRNGGGGEALEAYGDRVRTFTAATEIGPGFAAEPVVGHTPGHSVYQLRSGDARLVFAGDLIHVVAVQAPRPDATVTYDADQPAAREARLAFLRANTGDAVLFAGPHFPHPGVGRFLPEGQGYRYAPAAPGG